VRKALAAFCERIERGDAPELAVALLPFESKAALWAWWGVPDESRESFRGASAAREPGIQRHSHVCLDPGSRATRSPGMTNRRCGFRDDRM
jgi:hypothetical protein